MYFNIKQNGFCGKLFKTQTPVDKEKVVIICGGSSGDHNLTNLLSEFICMKGIDTLSLWYINKEGVPKHTIEAPIESASNAVKWLKEYGYSKIAIYGVSSGGEYALAAASLIPEITNVIAVSAPTVISQADNGIIYKNTSSWSWRGIPLPFLKINYSLIKAIPKMIYKRELYVSYFYERAITHIPNDAFIKIENINGPILFITAQHDTICPSSLFAELACKRLDEYDFKYSKKHICYEYASHFLVPIRNPKKVPLKVFQIERKYPAECAKTRENMLDVILKWLRSW